MAARLTEASKAAGAEHSLLRLGDHGFWLAWREITEAERSALPADVRAACFARFQRVSSVATSQSSRAAARAAQANAGESINFADPMAAAEEIARRHYMAGSELVLQFWQEEFYLWAGAHYAVQPRADIRELLYRIGAAHSHAPVKKKHVDDVLDALRAVANLSSTTLSPAWISRRPSDPDPSTLIPMANGILNIGTGDLLASSPRLFSPYSLPFAYDQSAPTPERWLQFLRDLWPADDEAIELLGEWFGYCLTSNTEMQKALLLISPRRGGKGTIGRVLTALLGHSNVVSPTLSSLGLPFGLQPLIGKQLALLSDIRLGHHADLQAIAENLLRVTGEDAVSIPRKFLPDYTVTLLTRFVMFTNEAPRLIDGSGALPSRFLVLTSTASFYGREDHQLTAKLLAELPGIFTWALAGLRRLRERGRFHQPESAREIIEEIETLAAPVQAFIAETCETADPAAEVQVKDLFTAWRRWCAQNGREHPGTQQTLGRDVRTAMPHLRTRQPRVDGRQLRVYVGLRLRDDTQ